MFKLLLVEDDEEESRLYERLFTEEGFEVFKLKSGENCREAAVYFHPDIILMDLFMPKVNGLEALDTLHFHADTKDIPVIILTNISDPVREKDSYRRGASRFITKCNIENSELVLQVRSLISTRLEAISAQ